MKTLLSIGDRVQLNSFGAHESTYVGEGNMGTITEVREDYYVIEWDNPGPYTYREGRNKFQYNIACNAVELAGPPPTQQERICKKVKYLEDKFKQRKVHYDF